VALFFFKEEVRTVKGDFPMSPVTAPRFAYVRGFVWHLIWFLVSLQEELKTVAGDIPMSPVTFRRVVCVKGQPHVSRYGSELCVSVGDAWILLFFMCPKRCTYVRIKLRLATISVQIDRSQGRISAGSWRVVCVLKKHAQSTLFH
jgi:hypothetical protein